MFRLGTTYNSCKMVWSGPKAEPNPIADISIGEALFQQMKETPENICQISATENLSLTNNEMLTMSACIAQHLSLITSTDAEDVIVGIMCRSSSYQAPVFFGAFFNGIVVHPINPSSDQKAIVHMFGITRPKIVFCDEENYVTLMAACEELNLNPNVYTVNGRIDGIRSVFELLGSIELDNNFSPKCLKHRTDETAVIVGSSGTSGLPKGVCISHSHLIEPFRPFPSGSNIYTSSTTDWITGLRLMIYSLLSNCTRVITTEAFSQTSLRHIIEKYKVNILIMSAINMARFIKSQEAQKCDFSNLKDLVVGGGNVSQDLYTRMRELMKTGNVINSYGGTEFGIVAANYNILKYKCVGQIVEGVKVKIIDDDGLSLGIENVGEICVWNGRDWRGYLDNPVETEIVFDEEKWHHTGDCGYFDKDGDLYLADRKKEVVKRRGYQYSLKEIENCLSMLTEVEDVCVFATRDDEDGDLATAAVVKRPNSKLTAEDVKDYIQNLLPEPKWLHGGVFFVDDMPKAGSGKILRSKIRDMCLRSIFSKT